MRKPALLDFAEPGCGLHLVADFCQRGVVPEFLVIEWVSVFASLEEYPVHGGEVVLKSVIDAGQESRSERGLEHLAEEHYLASVLQTSGAFENLHGSLVSIHLDDLREEIGVSEHNVAELIFGHRSVHGHRNKVGHYSAYLSFSLHIYFCFLLSYVALISVTIRRKSSAPV